MNQEQIKRMEDAIATDYNNMVGMVNGLYQKNGLKKVLLNIADGKR